MTVLSRGRGTPATVTLGLEDQLASWDTGLVGELQRVDAPTADPTDTAGVIGYAGIAAGDGQQSTSDVGSYAFDPQIARARALGEAVDRYAWANAHRRPSRLATFRALGPEAALDPAKLAMPSPEERARGGLAAYHADLELAWTDGYRVRVSDSELVVEPALVPLQLFADPAHVPGARFTARYPTNTATGNTLVEAVTGVVAEVIERDALSLAWLTRAPATHVDLASIDHPDIARWTRHHQARGRTPLALALPSDTGVPTIAAALLDPAGPVHFVWAFATSLDPVQAIRKAIEELEGNRYAIPDAFDVPERPSDHRFFYWQRPDRLAELAFLTAPARVVPVAALGPARTQPTPYETLRYLVDALARIELETYFVDITPAELRDRLPLHAATAIVPGVINLMKPWHLDASRLATRGALHPIEAPIW